MKVLGAKYETLINLFAQRHQIDLKIALCMQGINGAILVDSSEAPASEVKELVKEKVTPEPKAPEFSAAPAARTAIGPDVMAAVKQIKNAEVRSAEIAILRSKPLSQWTPEELGEALTRIEGINA